MYQEEELTEEKSLAIIHQMIRQAKNNITHDGAGWLIWGSMIFVASLATYVLIIFKFDNTFLAWNIFGLVSIVLLLVSYFKKRTVTVRSYVDDVLRWVDMAFMISLFIVIFSMNTGVSPNMGFGLLLMLYAFLMLVQGGALKFTPLLIGAAVNWIGALAIFLNKDFKNDMLITAAAVFIGYIIPGLILRNQHNKMTSPTDGI